MNESGIAEKDGVPSCLYFDKIVHRLAHKLAEIKNYDVPLTCCMANNEES